ncbi:MAG: hypothetical protein LBU51_06535 [Bacteroidales bacterium]|jgi:hypothetical protein|nr:hypothetical protein [Bacteroidales bacterium]
MKKLLFILVVALFFGFVSCKKTCKCTQTITTTYPEDSDDSSMPTVTTNTFSSEAKKCSDLNADITIGLQRTVFECK